MKRILKILAVAVALTMTIATLSACGGISQRELSVVDKYNLTAIVGLDDVSVNDYDYNHITLKDNNKFVMENKSQDVVFSSTGKWNLSDDTLTLKLSGIFAKKETHTLSDKTIYFSGSIDGKTVTMEYTKIGDTFYN